MRISVADQVFVERVDGETVLLELASGRYFGLDPVASRLLELLVQLGTTEAVAEAALEEYDVSREQLSQDIEALVHQLVEHKLIVVEAHAAPTAP